MPFRFQKSLSDTSELDAWSIRNAGKSWVTHFGFVQNGEEMMVTIFVKDSAPQIEFDWLTSRLGTPQHT